jgi:hypothetical protein
MSPQTNDYENKTMRTLIITIYRVSALLMISAPIALNILFPSTITNSLLYTPLLSLVLASLTIYLDAKLLLSIECLTAKGQMKTKHHQPCPNIQFLSIIN